MASPLTGPAGNIEFLLHARRGVGSGPGTAGSGSEYEDLLAAAVAEVRVEVG
jgi:hypothetical protein